MSCNQVLEGLKALEAEKESIEIDTNYKYVGWIPCVSGHLDFGLITVGIQGGFTNQKKRDSNSFCNSFAYTGFNDNHARKIAIQSWVDWKDRLDGDGEFRVCILAKSEENDDLDTRELTGSVIVYPKTYEGMTGSHKCKLLDSLHDLNNCHSNKSQQHQRNWTARQKELNGLWDIAKKLVPESNESSPQKLIFGDFDAQMPNIYRVNFKILPNGLTYLNFIDLEGQEIEVDKQIICLTEDDKFVVCRQVFYYLKYSLHVHKHHEHKADALTSIVPSDQQTGLKLIGQIKRELLAIKRIQLNHQRFHHSSEAVGIIGYLNSLLVALASKKLIKRSQYLNEKSRAENIEKSFMGQTSRISDSYTKRTNVSSSSKQITMMVMSYVSLCFLAFVNLFRNGNAGTVDASVIELISQSQTHFVAFPVALMCAMLAFYWTMNFYYSVREHKVGFWKWVYKQKQLLLYAICIAPPLIVYLIASNLSL